MYEVVQVTCSDECRAEERRRGHRKAEECEEQGYVMAERPEVADGAGGEDGEQEMEQVTEIKSEIKVKPKI